MIEWFFTFWPWFVGATGFLAAMAVTVHAVLWKRDTRAVIAWVGLAWLAPVVGPIVYWCFGVNRIQRKAVTLRFRQAGSRESARISRDAARAVGDELERDYPGMLGLALLGQQVNQRPLVPGNQVRPLVNGDEAYPAMLRAIEQAQRSVALLSYIFDADRVGNQFLDSLVDAQTRGVEVRVLIDHVGARYSRPNMIRRLRRGPDDGELPTHARAAVGAVCESAQPP